MEWGREKVVRRGDSGGATGGRSRWNERADRAEWVVSCLFSQWHERDGLGPNVYPISAPNSEPYSRLQQVSNADRCCHAGDGEDSDVVLLTEGLRGVGKSSAGGAFLEQLCDTLEAEEMALGVLRFGDAIGHQHQ